MYEVPLSYVEACISDPNDASICLIISDYLWEVGDSDNSSLWKESGGFLQDNSTLFIGGDPEIYSADE